MGQRNEPLQRCPKGQRTCRFKALRQLRALSTATSEGQSRTQVLFIRYAWRFIAAKFNSLLGTMNEFAFLADGYREYLEVPDLLSLSIKLSGTPCGPLKGNSPGRVVREIVTGGSA